MVALAACGAGDPNANKDTGEKQLRVGVTVYDMSSFITQGQEGMQAFAKANNIELLWNSANGDVATQASQVDQLINQRVDAIIIVPVQADSLGPQLRCGQGRQHPGDRREHHAIRHGRAHVLGAARRRRRRRAGDADDGRQARRSRATSSSCRARSARHRNWTAPRASNRSLAKYPGIKVLAKDTANWKRDEAVNKMKNWLSELRRPASTASSSENDDMGLGAVQALSEAGKSIPVVGIDGIQDGLAAVKDGEFIGTSLQHGRVEMAEGLAVAQKVANG